MILSGFETNSSAKQVITTWTGIHSIRTIKTAFFTRANLKLEDYMEISIPLETPIANAVDAGDNSGHGGFGDGHGGFCSRPILSRILSLFPMCCCSFYCSY